MATDEGALIKQTGWTLIAFWQSMLFGSVHHSPFDVRNWILLWDFFYEQLIIQKIKNSFENCLCCPLSAALSKNVFYNHLKLICAKIKTSVNGRKDGNKHLIAGAHSQITVLQQHRYERIEIVACRVAKSKTTSRLSMTRTWSSFTT